MPINKASKTLQANGAGFLNSPHSKPQKSPKELWIKFIFVASSLLMLAFVIFNVKNLQSDIYKLLELESASSQAFNALNQKSALELNLLSPNLALLESLEQKALESGLFERFTLRLNADFTAPLKQTLIASLDEKSAQELLKTPEKFLLEGLKSAFFSFHALPLGEDLFNLAQHSSFLSASKALNLDLQTQVLFAKFKDKRYYFARAKLKPNYDSKALLEFYRAAKTLAKTQKSELIAHSNALYASMGKVSGESESLYMSVLSVLFLGALLYLAFGKLRILGLFSVVVFSLLFGLSAGFVLLGTLHLLSLVISTALAGLVLDFAMHWLALNQGRVIERSSIRRVKRLFMLGIFITCAGYALFLSSPMRLLQEVAVIAIFTLVAAFLASYFLLPLLFKGVEFNSKPLLNVFLLIVLKALKALKMRGLGLIFMALILLSAFGVYAFLKSDFKDDIKHYARLDTGLLKDSELFLNIMQKDVSAQILLVSESSLDKEKALLDALQKAGLIGTYEALSQFFLSESEQNAIKERLQGLLKDEAFLKEGENLGFSRADIQNALLNLMSLDEITLQSLAKPPFNEQFDGFLLTQNNDSNNALNNFSNAQNGALSSVIFVQNANTNEAFFEILKAYNAKILDISEQINTQFSAIKLNAIYLKILAYALAFVLFVAFFGLLRAGVMLCLLFLANALSLFVLFVLGIHFNIFVIFALILGGAVGVDYMLFALSAHRLKARVLGILLASLTSFISFILLVLSSTNAVRSFGLGVCLMIAFCAFFALLLARFSFKF